MSGFLRLSQVLEIYPVGRSSWLAGVKSGRFPKPIRLSQRTVAWLESDIRELVKRAVEAAGRTESAAA